MTGNNNIHTRPAVYWVWTVNDRTERRVEADSAFAARKIIAKQLNVSITTTMARREDPRP